MYKNKIDFRMVWNDFDLATAVYGIMRKRVIPVSRSYRITAVTLNCLSERFVCLCVPVIAWIQPGKKPDDIPVRLKFSKRFWL
jgi:hypothetical protein